MRISTSVFAIDMKSIYKYSNCYTDYISKVFASVVAEATAWPARTPAAADRRRAAASACLEAALDAIWSDGDC